MKQTLTLEEIVPILEAMTTDIESLQRQLFDLAYAVKQLTPVPWPTTVSAKDFPSDKLD